MKNRITIISCLAIFLVACNSNQAPKQATDTISKKITGIRYTCPMHPAIVTNKPGTCPKCGMELVEKDDSK